MSSVDQFLITLAAILALGSLGGYVFSRLSIPDAIWLIGAGVVLGPVLGFLQRDTLVAIAPFFGALNGGRPAARTAASTAGSALTARPPAGQCRLPF